MRPIADEATVDKTRYAYLQLLGVRCFEKSIARDSRSAKDQRHRPLLGAKTVATTKRADDCATAPTPINTKKDDARASSASSISQIDPSAFTMEAFDAAESEFRLPAWALERRPQFDPQLPEMTLSLLQFANQVLVVYDASHNPHLPNNAELQMIERMMQACQVSGELRVNYFKWPQLPPTTRLILDRKVARRALRVYLQYRLRKHPVRWLLLLGRAPACYLLDQQQLERSFEQLREPASSAKPAITTWNTLTLVSEDIAVLTDRPENKKQVWQELQVLRAYFSQSHAEASPRGRLHA